MQSASINRGALVSVMENVAGKYDARCVHLYVLYMNSLWWAKGIHPAAGLLQPDPMGHLEESPELKTAPLPTSHHLQGRQKRNRVTQTFSFCIRDVYCLFSYSKQSYNNIAEAKNYLSNNMGFTMTDADILGSGLPMWDYIINI